MTYPQSKKGGKDKPVELRDFNAGSEYFSFLTC